MLLWGAMTMSIAGAKNYGGLVATRFLLGAAEAGLFPGLVYCLTFWYKPNERAFRVALILAGATLGGAFGSAIAFGIGKINGAGGLQAWRWLFLIEGLPSIALSPIILLYYPDYPETVRWLSDNERALATERIRGVASLGHAKLTWVDARDTLLDWRLYLHHLVWIAYSVAFSSISLFAPTIVQGLGFTGLGAQLFTVPPYAIAFVVVVTVAWLADRHEARSLAAIGSFTICGVSFLIQGMRAENERERLCGSHVLLSLQEPSPLPHSRRATRFYVSPSRSHSPSLGPPSRGSQGTFEALVPPRSWSRSTYPSLPSDRSSVSHLSRSLSTGFSSSRVPSPCICHHSTPSVAHAPRPRIVHRPRGDSIPDH